MLAFRVPPIVVPILSPLQRQNSISFHIIARRVNDENFAPGYPFFFFIQNKPRRAL